MKSSGWLLLTLLLAGCGSTARKDDVASKPNRPIPKAQQFFSDWLKDHGHTDIEVGSNGVGIAGNPTRLSASLYESNQNANGYVIEAEFRIQLGSGREIVEFLAGMGKDEEAAINDSLLNFVVTTFHPVYKAFINADDPHMESETIEIDGKSRELIMGDLYLRRPQDSAETDLNEMRSQIRDALKSLKLSSEPHWIKLVYLQIDNQPKTVSVTVDNGENRALTDQIAKLKWPQSEGFYIAKQFIVIK
jgi:Family of unknown function (DUF6348)